MASARKMSEEDRRYAQSRGNQLDRWTEDRGQQERERRGYYTGYADEAYSPLIAGGGGYSEGERESIMREGDLANLQQTPQEAESAYLNDAERGAVMGDPYSPMRYFDPENMRTMQAGSEGRQRGAVTGMQEGLSSAIDPSRLGMDEGFLGDSETALGTSDQFLQDYSLSPEMQQSMVTAAGTSAANRYGGAISDLERQSRAAGMDPVGVAAMRARLEREAAGESGDAMTRARIAADSERARRLMGGEQMRQTGAQNVADLRFGREGVRSGAERDISNRRMDAATTGGAASLDAERGINQQQQGVARYATDTGSRLQAGAEQAAADRARDVSLNRQGTSRYNQEQRYGRGMDANQALSGRSAGVADKRLDEAREGRGYLREQVGLTTGTEQAENDRLAQGYATQGGLTQGATQNKIQADKQPAPWERVAAAGLGAAASYFGGKAEGGVFNSPTNVIVGEDGPEAIVPLDGRDDANVLPSVGAGRYGRPNRMSPPPAPRYQRYGAY